MKKLMFILLLIIPVFIINAQDIQPKEELASVQVIDHLYDKTSQAISELAKALEVPAEHAYNVLVRQQIIYAISSLLAIGLFIIVFIIMIKIGYSWWQNKNDEYNRIHDTKDNYKYYDFDDGAWCILIGGGYISLGITLIVLFCMVGDIFTGIFNPEYGAIKDIMSIL